MNFVEKESRYIDNHLLGKELGLQARDLLYIHADVEERFNIKLSQEEIAAGKFSTFNNIYKIICKQLNKKEMEEV